MRQFDQAERYLLKAAPQAPAAWYGLARLYLLQGKYEEAEKFAQRIEDSGQADELVGKMLQAAKGKKLSDGLRAMIEPQAPAKSSNEAKPATTAAQAAPADAQLVEGVGWGNVHVGASKEELIKALGKPDDDSTSDYLKWDRQHIRCGFHSGETDVGEVQFNPGFRGALANGITLGSPENTIVKLYGKPEKTTENPYGAKACTYPTKGICFWTYQGKVSQIIVFKPEMATGASEPRTDRPALADAIVEGVGWGKIRIGAKREEVIKALGKPDDDSTPDYLKWAKQHIACGIHYGETGIGEVQFNPGFQGVLANGIKLGSPENTLLELYGKPDKMTENPYGAKMRTYAKRGILFWTYQGKVSQIVVFKPKPGPEPTEAKDDRPAASDATAEGKQDGMSSDNLLANPSAENGDKTPDAWEQGAKIPGVKYAWDKKVASQGKASLSIEKTAKSYYPIAQWSQTVDRKGDLPKLEVSAQVRTRKMFKAALDVIFLDKSGNWISRQWAAYIGAEKDGDPPADHDWKKYSGTVDIPPGTAKITIALQDYGPGKVWFDDVQATYAK
jgi:hypothetical protein